MLNGKGNTIVGIAAAVSSVDEAGTGGGCLVVASVEAGRDSDWQLTSGGEVTYIDIYVDVSKDTDNIVY